MLVEEPFVSFIIPAYNVERFIPKTIKSVLDQTDQDYEIVIVNDGSTDQTVEVVEKILSSSNFLRYRIIHKENGGVSSARNVGLAYAKGRYIVFLDGDDYIAPTLVKKIKDLGSIENFDAICWRYEMVNVNGELLKNPFKHYETESKLLYDGFSLIEEVLVSNSFSVCTGSVAYLHDKIRSLGFKFSEGTRIGEDLEFEFKFLITCKKIAFIPDTLAFYVQKPAKEMKEPFFPWFDMFGAMARVREYYEKVGREMWGTQKMKPLEEAVVEYALLTLITYIARNVWVARCLSESFSILKYVESKFGETFRDVLNYARNNRKFVSKRDFRAKLAYRFFLMSPKGFVLANSIYGKLRNFFRHAGPRLFKVSSTWISKR